MTILDNLKIIFNDRPSLLQDNILLIIRFHEESKITKEFLDYCVNKNIIIEVHYVHIKYKYLSNKIKYKICKDITIDHHFPEPLVLPDNIKYTINLCLIQNIKLNKIKKFINEIYLFNEYKNFIYINIMGFILKEEAELFIDTLIKIVSHKIPYIYIVITDEYDYYTYNNINNYIFNIINIIKIKEYNNFIYIYFPHQKIYKDILRYYNFANISIYNFKTKKKEYMHNKVLYYFLMYIIL